MKGNFIVFDCETGGLERMKNPITQIALMGVDRKTGKELGRYETFIKPYGGDDFTISKEALEKSMVDLNELRRAPEASAVVKDIIDFTRKVAGGKITRFNAPVLVGHNVSFDIGFLEVLFVMANKSMSDYFAVNNDVFLQIDTQRYASWVWPELNTLTLGSCCKEAGITLVDAHGAMNDVVATKKLFSFFRSGKNIKNNLPAAEDEATEVKSRKFFQI